MEEEKAAAYYDELTRKGEGAARFKQGLGFSFTTANDTVPSSSSSFLSSFVRASTPSKPSDLQKEAQLITIQNKLQKKHNPSQNNINHCTQSASRYPDRDRDRDRHSSRHNRSPGRDDHRVEMGLRLGRGGRGGGAGLGVFRTKREDDQGVGEAVGVCRLGIGDRRRVEVMGVVKVERGRVVELTMLN